MMERQLFSWENWDQQDTGAFSFYNCRLNDGVEIPRTNEQREFSHIYVDYQRGYIEFTLNDDSLVKYELALEILQ